MYTPSHQPAQKLLSLISEEELCSTPNGWARPIMSRGRSASRRGPSSSRGQIRAAVEAMEPRLVLSTFVVNTFIDQIDLPNSPTVSLRDAVTRAAATAGADTINVPAGTFKLVKGELLISDTSGAVTLQALSGTAILTGTGIPAVLGVAATTTVSASGLTITGNTGVNSGGGGIINAGTLTLSRSVVSNNFESHGNGGGINNSGTLLLQDSTVSGNTTTFGSGAGLYNTGAATAINTTFLNNSARQINGDVYSRNGGGIASTGTLTLTNCTLAGNTANSVGGGLDNLGLATISDSTISANTGFGGGIANEASGTLTLANSIVAGNLPFNGVSSPDASGLIDSRGHNLIGQIDGSSGWIAGDLTGTAAHPLDPKLSPVGIYGGPTETFFPLPGSPAIGMGSLSLIPAGVTTDQRGFPRVVAGKVEIGSVELQKTTVVTVTPPAKQNVVAGVSASVNLGSFVDPGGKGPFTVDVNYGDGSPDSSFSVAAPGALGVHPHTFLNTGSLTGTIVVIDASGDISNVAPFSISSALAPASTFVVNTIIDQVDLATSKTISLRDAVNRADASLGPVTISFDPTVFAKLQTIKLVSKQLELGGNKFAPITLTGPLAGVIVNANRASGVFVVDPLVTASFLRFTLTGGISSGLTNNGTVAFNAGAITANSALNGGGISNSGALTLADSTVSGNSVNAVSDGRGGFNGGNGGGVFNSGALTIARSNITGNTASFGGGIHNSGTLTIDSSTVGGNHALYSQVEYGGSGGGIANISTLTLTRSTLSSNTSEASGGGFANYGGDATLINSTLASNTASRGGAIDNAAALALKDCTLSGNTATTGGGGIYNNYSGNRPTLANTIVAGNSVSGNGATSPDVGGAVTSLGHNLIGKIDGSTGWIAADLTGTIARPLDPKLSQLGNFGGPTQTLFPLPGSPALGAGSVALIPSGAITDQRGFVRVVSGKVDIGADEMQAASKVVVTPPNTQNVVAGVSALVNLGSFADPTGKGPFSVDINYGDGSPDTLFTVTAPGSLGARAHIFTNTGSLTGTIVVTDALGNISNIAPLSVTSAVAPALTLVVNTVKDQVDPAGSTTVSLRDAVNRADGSFGPVTITFSPTVFAAHQTIILNRANLEFGGNHFGLITLTGPTAGVTINANNTSGVLVIDKIITANFSNLTLIGGSDSGINNAGRLTLTNSTISGNHAKIVTTPGGNRYGAGGGIDNTGTATVINSTISGNTGAVGGGVFNSGAMTISASTLAGNHSYYSHDGHFGDGDGGGIFNATSLTLTNSTLSGNIADNDGGGIATYTGTTFLLNSTIVGNSATTHTGHDGGGGLYDFSSGINIGNTIIAGNTVSGANASAPDISAGVTSLGHNLIGKTDGSSGWVATDLVGTVAHPLDPKLSALGNFGGPTQTRVPLLGSPALNGGSTALVVFGNTTDQRGLPRIISGTVDIGAVELHRVGSFTGTPAPFGRIQAENFDLGGQYIGYFNPSNTNQGGQYRPTEGVGIGAITAAGGGGYFVGYTVAGESLNYTSTVAATGTYTLNFRVASVPIGGTFHLNVDGINVTGALAVPASGNANIYKIVSKVGVHLTAGAHMLQLVIDSAGVSGVAGNFDYFEAIKTA